MQTIEITQDDLMLFVPTENSANIFHLSKDNLLEALKDLAAKKNAMTIKGRNLDELSAAFDKKISELKPEAKQPEFPANPTDVLKGEPGIYCVDFDNMDEMLEAVNKGGDWSAFELVSVTRKDKGEGKGFYAILKMN